MFPPRSSSLQKVEIGLVGDDASMRSERSMSVYSTTLPEKETSRTQSLCSESNESKGYHDNLHRGTDTLAPFLEMAQTGENTIHPLKPPDFDAIEPRPSSPPLAFISDSRKLICYLGPVDATSDTLYQIARNMTRGQLASLSFGPQLDIKNSSTGETYVRNVPQRMLFHFCVHSSIERRFKLSIDDEGPDTLEIAPSEAEKSGVVRVIRYMRRWCTSCGAAPTGEMRVPPSMRVGIETMRACRLFGLHADAGRIEELLVDTYMGSENWAMTDEHVELIWDDYHGPLRDTAFGDAIVWFILAEVQNDANPLADEIKWMMEQQEYELLRERVKEENMRKSWRYEGRRQFLKRCKTERDQLRRQRRQQRKIAKEIEKRVRETRVSNENTSKRVLVVPVSAASKDPRPEAPKLNSQYEQRPSHRSGRNAVSTPRPTETSITAATNSMRAEERHHPVRRVPSTGTQLSDLWNDQPDLFRVSSRASTSGTNKFLPNVSRNGGKVNTNKESNSAGESRENTDLPRPTSLRTHRPDILHPHEHRGAVRQPENTSDARKSRVDTRTISKPGVPPITDMKWAHTKPSGFWKKLLASE